MTRSIVTVDPSRPGRRPLSARWPQAASRAASVVAGATWLLGILTVASALLPPDRARLRLLTELLPYQAADAAAAVAAALGVLLLYLAGGLRRRKHRAWVAAVVVTAVVGLSHLAKGLDVEEAGASAVVLALLLGCRREFGAEADPGGRRLAVRRFGSSRCWARRSGCCCCRRTRLSSSAGPRCARSCTRCCSGCSGSPDRSGSPRTGPRTWSGRRCSASGCSPRS